MIFGCPGLSFSDDNYIWIATFMEKNYRELFWFPENRHFLFHLQTKEATNNASHSANIQQK